jgi:hypothetical protein
VTRPHRAETAGEEWLYRQDGDLYLPSRYTEGPWDPEAQFGGCPSALLITLVEQMPSLVPMRIARFTLDLLRPVPLAPLRADVRVVREGKRIQAVSASLLVDDLLVARASAVRVRVLDLGPHLAERDANLPDGASANTVPEAPRPVDEEPFPDRVPPGSRYAVEYLYEGRGGYFRDPTWVRLKVPPLAGQPISPVARLAYTADLGNGVGHVRGLPLTGINLDLAINIVRYPDGEWLCLDGRGWISPIGVGQVQGTISDPAGLCCTLSMVRLVDPA